MKPHGWVYRCPLDILCRMTISEQLRKIMKDSGKSALAMSKEFDIPQTVLSRFLRGEGISISTADSLAECFGLELTPKAIDKPAKMPLRK